MCRSFGSRRSGWSDVEYPHSLQRVAMRLSVAVPGAAALVLGLILVRPERSEASTRPLYTVPLALSDGCDYHCRECGTVSDPKHDIVVHYSTNDHKSAHLENCNAGSCSLHTCGQSFASISGEVGPREVIALNASGIEMAKLARNDPANIRLNSERQALQVYCDKGEIVANIPLSDEQLAEFHRSVSLGR
jgi:hypothetical protein